MDLVEIARWLNRERVSAAPCPWLHGISIFVDEHYENYDYDLIGPRDRKRIAAILSENGFEQQNSRVFVSSRGRIEFPKPTRSLASDPGEEIERVIDAGESIALATPTQVLLTTWRREGPHLSDERRADLLALVREQPANLDKVRDWLRRTDRKQAYGRLYPRLEAAQREGFDLRRRGAFRSQLPR